MRSGLMACQLSPVVRGLHHILRAEIKRLWILGREDERRHLRSSKFRAAHKNMRDLAGDFVEAHDAAVPAAGINDVGIRGIRRDVTEFKSADGEPIAEADLTVIAAIRHRDGAAVLLRGVRIVGKLVVRDHVVELAGRLVVPTAPRFAAVHADGGALIDTENHAL